MLQAVIERSPDRVACVGLRHWLRVSRSADGALAVEEARLADPRWRRVDHDLVLVTRAVMRLLTDDAGAARSFTRAAAEVAGVTVRDTNPVTGLVRATYPLLAGAPPFPLPAVPVTLPPALQPAFRTPHARTAAARLFGNRRATRPVVRSLCALLAVEPADLLLVTVATAVKDLLEPDHLARLLAVRAPTTADRRPLAPDDGARLASVLADLPAGRRLRLLEAGLSDATDRDRLRFVASAAEGAAPDDARTGWDTLALSVALRAPVAS